MRSETTETFLLNVDDVDWRALSEKLRDSAGSPLSQRINELLTEDTQKILAAAQTTELDQTQKDDLVLVFNELLKRRDFCPASCERIPVVVKMLRDRKWADLPENEIIIINRRVMEEAYPSEIKEIKPYVGPPSYKRKQRGFFFGRDDEAIELASLITARSAVLIYSQSGAGKTSLLNAKLIPKLEEEEYFSVLPPMRVQGRIPSTFKIGKKTNIFVINALMSCQEGDVNPATLAGVTFGEFLRGRPQCINQYGEPSPTVLVFDQFEELFTSYPTRWPDREAFFEQIGEALQGNPKKGIQGDPMLRVVFCMREDYIAELDPYLHYFPDKLRTRFRLEHLRKNKALLAITRPLETTKRSFDTAVAEQLVKNLLKIPSQSITGTQSVGLYVEPVQLQVVCQTLWDALTPNETMITQKHLDKYGDVGQALSKFYERSIRCVALETGEKEERLRNWFGDTLISAEGTRAPVNRGQEHTGGMSNVAVEKLEAMRLIKGEWKGTNVRWYELAHDRFIEPIRRSNDAWLAEQTRGEQIRLRLEAKATKWQAGGSILEAGELLEAQRLGKSGVASKALRQLVDASRAKAQKKRIRSLKLIVAGAAVLAVLFLVMAVVAIKQWKLAQKAEGIAKSRLLANKAAVFLESDPELSVLLGKEAIDQYEDTEEARNVIRGGLLNLSNVAGAFMGHEKAVRTAVFSPDGRFVLTTSDDLTTRLWDANTRNLVTKIGEKEHDVRYAAFSPNGKLIITAGGDAVARLWDGTTGALIRELRGHERLINWAAFSPDSNLVATASEDATARVWNTGTGELFKTLTGHQGPVKDITFSPDGEHIATEAADATGRIWALRSSKVIVLNGLTGEKPAIAFSPDGKLIATEGGLNTETGSRRQGDYPVTVWDSITGKSKLVLGGHEGSITGVTFSPDAQFIVTSSADNTAQLWNIKGELIAVLTGHTKAVSSALFSPNGKFLLTASADNTARIWRSDTGATLAPLRGHSMAVNSAVFSPDSQSVLTSSDDESVRLWRVEGQDKRSGGSFLNEHFGRVNSAAFSPDGTQVITTDSEMGALIEVVTDVPLRTALLYNRSNPTVVDAVFSPDGNFVATASNNSAKLWKIRREGIGGVMETIQGRILDAERVFGDDTSGVSQTVNSVAFSRDGKFVVTSNSDTAARVWDVSSGAMLGELRGHNKKVNSAAFSPDGRFIVTAGDDKEVRIWDAGSYSLVRRIGPFQSEVSSAQYSNDGRLIVTASGNVARVWNASTGDSVVELKGHTDKINRVSFSGDDRLIVSSSADKTARVWDARKGKIITVLRQGGNVLDAKFSPDGRSLVTACEDSTARIYSYWEFGYFEELMGLIPQRVVRSLTPDERKAYLVEPEPGVSGLLPSPAGRL